MKIADVRKRAFAMPLTSPAFPPGPYRFVDREYLIIAYRTDKAALEAVIPEPLTFDEPIVKYEFIRMPDSTGFGDYSESGQVVPVKFKGKDGNYTLAMFLNDGPPIYGGRELWGFPKKYAQPTLCVDRDTLRRHARLRARAHRHGNHGLQAQGARLEPSPRRHGEAELFAQDHPACRRQPAHPRAGRLPAGRHRHERRLVGARHARPHPHALAPIAELPVREVISATHIVADLTLGLGKVVYDYLKD